MPNGCLVRAFFTLANLPATTVQIQRRPIPRQKLEVLSISRRRQSGLTQLLNQLRDVSFSETLPLFKDRYRLIRSIPGIPFGRCNVSSPPALSGSSVSPHAAAPAPGPASSSKVRKAAALGRHSAAA